MNQFNLVVGDWSDDGHGKTGNITLQTNFDYNQMVNAYTVLNQKYDWLSLCQDYEENKITDEHVELWLKNGFDWNNHSLFEAHDDYGLDYDTFAELYLELIKHEFPAFEYKIVNNSNFNIGGYGLFY